MKHPHEEGFTAKSNKSNKLKKEGKFNASKPLSSSSSPSSPSFPSSFSTFSTSRLKWTFRSKPRPLPYSYIPGKSFLHRLGGGWKLLALFLVSTLAFALGIPALLPGTLLVAVCSLAAGIRPRRLLRGIRPLLVMALLTTLCRSFAVESGSAAPVLFSRRGFGEGLVFGWSILLAFCAASLFFSTTTMTQIKDSLDRFHLQRLSLGLSLMLGFLPRFFAVWEGADLAYRARGGKKGFRQLTALVPLTMERMIISAGETATALEARGLWRRAEPLRSP